MTLPRTLITGAGGMLAHALIAELKAHHVDVVPLSRAQLDVTDALAVRRAFEMHDPGIVIQCAAYTRVDDAETHRDLAFAVNATGALNVAEACRARGARFVYPSTDYVFDGRATVPYAPDAPRNPLNVYGRSKAAGEDAAMTSPDSLIVRTASLYGPGGPNFVRTMSQRMEGGGSFRIVDDQTVAPTWTLEVSRALLKLLEADAVSGVYHLTSRGATTWFDFARVIMDELDMDAPIEPCSSRDLGRPASRPAYSILDLGRTEHLIGDLPAWAGSLRQALHSGEY